MVATFALELVLAIYTVAKYKLNSKGRVIIALLICLAAFQLAEYFVCTSSSVAISSARVGFAAITLLPGLAFYLMALLTKPLSRKLTVLMLVATLLIAGYFLVAPQAFDGYQCTGNYVMFQIGRRPAILYGLFYFGLILFSILKGVRFLGTEPGHEKARPVQWFIAGYAMFIVPVAVLTVFHPDTSRAIPSVLCGFAVTLAVVLVVKVAPLTLKRR